MHPDIGRHNRTGDNDHCSGDSIGRGADLELRSSNDEHDELRFVDPRHDGYAGLHNRRDHDDQLV